MGVENVILFIFAAISIPLYLLILIMLIKNRQESSFKSAFYKLFISLGVIDICQILNSYFTIRCAMFGYFKPLYEANQTGFLPKYACFTLWYFVYGQFVANLILALNRYTAFRYFWTFEDKIWTPRMTRCAYLLPWILPFFIAFYCWFQDARYAPLQDLQNNTIGYAVVLSNEAYMVNTIVAKLIILTVTLFTLLAYVVAAVHLSKVSNSIGPTTYIQNGLKVEYRLMVCALLIFISMLIYVLYQVLTFVIIMTKRADLMLGLYDWWYIVADQFTLINPWSILASSKTVRRGLLHMLGWRPNTAIVTTIRQTKTT